MKQAHLRQKTKLTKGLLIVALLFSLFTFLGDIITYQARLETTTKTELVVTDRQEFGQCESESERLQSLAPKRFFACQPYSIVALLAYNKLVCYQIDRVSSTSPLATHLNKFFQRKTIPASFEAPYPNGSWLQANPLS